MTFVAQVFNLTGMLKHTLGGCPGCLAVVDLNTHRPSLRVLREATSPGHLPGRWASLGNRWPHQDEGNYQGLDGTTQQPPVLTMWHRSTNTQEKPQQSCLGWCQSNRQKWLCCPWLPSSGGYYVILIKSKTKRLWDWKSESLQRHILKIKMNL